MIFVLLGSFREQMLAMYLNVLELGYLLVDFRVKEEAFRVKEDLLYRQRLIRI